MFSPYGINDSERVAKRMKAVPFTTPFQTLAPIDEHMVTNIDDHNHKPLIPPITSLLPTTSKRENEEVPAAQVYLPTNNYPLMNQYFGYVPYENNINQRWFDNIPKPSTPSFQQPQPQACFICFGSTANEPSSLVSGRTVHNKCFLCSLCKSPLVNSPYVSKENSFYCQNCFLQTSSNITTTFPTPTKKKINNDNFSASLVAQPAKFQIANYNINPAPAMSLDGSIPSNETIHAVLIETTSGMIVTGGFQSGDVRVYRGGSKMVYFTGLKLNKMAPIKADLSSRNIKVADTTFCVRFTMGGKEMISDTFKIVSSCSQLPDEIRNAVRPAKRAYDKPRGRKKKNSEEEEDGTEEGKKKKEEETQAEREQQEPQNSSVINQENEEDQE